MTKKNFFSTNTDKTIALRAYIFFNNKYSSFLFYKKIKLRKAIAFPYFSATQSNGDTQKA